MSELHTRTEITSIGFHKFHLLYLLLVCAMLHMMAIIVGFILNVNKKELKLLGTFASVSYLKVYLCLSHGLNELMLLKPYLYVYIITSFALVFRLFFYYSLPWFFFKIWYFRLIATWHFLPSGEQYLLNPPCAKWRILNQVQKACPINIIFRIKKNGFTYFCT